jgi:superfamily II DNA or RNA helicase
MKKSNVRSKNNKTVNYAPGMRIVVRDAEWIVRQADPSADGGYLIKCDGLSELVRGKEGLFLTSIENDPQIGAAPIEILDPATTRLVEDRSSNYRGTLLYIESLLRQRVPTDENIHFGHQAAMDPLPFQLDPTLTALKQPQQRILIADTVGLGKTLEAGILMSELMRRGKGKRILVLAVKSMLTQFQKEMWNRFSIPLTRLDSTGLQRVRNKIPTNHNPFHFFDKSIISIDTLKQDIEYRHYLEQAYWDIIVIDEAHNVAERGSNSQRSRLAKLLASRSDTLIMLSATPHDGRPESFASLMNMLDATAISNPKDYKHEDFNDKGLVVRRFKKDVKDQIAKEFPERQIETIRSNATAIEEDAYQELLDANFGSLDKSSEGGQNHSRLFRVTLEKALFSSPMACLSTVNNRLNKLKNKDECEFYDDINTLKSLAQSLKRIDAPHFSKYQRLLTLIQDKKSGFGWKPNKKDDRIVIFTESIPTLQFLQQHLTTDLDLKDGQLAVLHGQMPDTDIMDIVESFGKLESKIRVLVCSDVASEGINLHYQSHKMIHFDIPWSLMVFQQRNGRIDRYGQSHQPQIRYMITESQNDKIRGDSRILEVLIEKDDQAQLNIGDPSEFTGVYDQESEEDQVAKVISESTFDGADLLAAMFDTNVATEHNDNPLAFMGEQQVSHDDSEVKTLPSLYSSNVEYAKQVLELAKRNGQSIEYNVTGNNLLSITAPKELKQRFNMLPPEIYPENGQFLLSENVAEMNAAIEQSRGDQHAWPKIHYLWQLHPVMQWLNDKVLSHFGRHQAPILRMPQHLSDNIDVFLLSAVFPNRKSHPLINDWTVVTFENGEYKNLQPFDDFLLQHNLANISLSNPGTANGEARLQTLLPKAIDKAALHFDKVRDVAMENIDNKLYRQLDILENLRAKHIQQLEIQFDDISLTRIANKKQSEQERVTKLFDNYVDWIKDTMTTEKQPYIQVIAVFTGAQG